jgi:hypothetical protein
MSAPGDVTRDGFRRLIYRVRAIPGQRFGLRPHTLTRVVHLAASVRDDRVKQEISITEANGQPPKVRWLKSEELTVGGLNPGTVEVGPITPMDASGVVGTDIALLRGDDLQPNDKLYFRIQGPHHPDGALYRKTKLTDDRALRFMLQLEPVETETLAL